jgi:hypothetical protein
MQSGGCEEAGIAVRESLLLYGFVTEKVLRNSAQIRGWFPLK